MFSLRKFFKLGSTSYLDLAKHAYRDFVDHDCSEHAAAMAYYFLFALFPFFLFLTTLIGVPLCPIFWITCSRTPKGCSPVTRST